MSLEKKLKDQVKKKIKGQIRTKIKKEIINVVKEAEFPVEDLEVLFNLFPEGRDTVYKISSFEFTVGEAEKLLENDDFPFKNPEEIANVILERLEI
ncbi:MTH865 family protein [Selenihalanaerobacter shriftii]|uniref:Uncharacterized protein n=1 Tax=Selenihalanaerobacter shriftii TaxID=142842 RepID=A0A1T4KFN0_9FIRM|nr:MTH865 family protein [Selenihalanaerobacter shriftii]SJZ41214.1 hypothetical protein SAMN02745118_00758 [Selenihalanaerobacter shriftii]